MTFWLRPAFWLVVVLGLIWAPVLVAPLFELSQVDPAKCTLEAKACDKLRQ